MFSPIVLGPIGLVLLNGYALVLVLLRAPAYRTRVYRPMILNIGLSLSPTLMMTLTVVAMTLAAAFHSGVVIYLVLGLGGIFWLLMLPNAAYLITELNLSHRRPEETVPLWYDIMLVLTLAVSGVFNTLFNVALAQLAFAALLTPIGGDPLASRGPWVAALVTLFAVAFGIYLGRYLRFNSWDLRHPMSFVSKLGAHFAVAGHRRTALAFVGTHAVFLAIAYLVVCAPWVVFLLSGR